MILADQSGVIGNAANEWRWLGRGGTQPLSERELVTRALLGERLLREASSAAEGDVLKEIQAGVSGLDVSYQVLPGQRERLQGFAARFGRALSEFMRDGDAVRREGVLALWHRAGVVTPPPAPKPRQPLLVGKVKPPADLTKAAREQLSAQGFRRLMKETRGAAPTPAQLVREVEFERELAAWKGELAGVSLLPYVVRDGAKDSIRYRYTFDDLEASFRYVLALVLDSDRPFGRDLCHCNLEECGRFFLVEPAKTKPRRRYCSEEHLTRHHEMDAKNRVARMRAREKRRRR